MGNNCTEKLCRPGNDIEQDKPPEVVPPVSPPSPPPEVTVPEKTIIPSAETKKTLLELAAELQKSLNLKENYPIEEPMFEIPDINLQFKE
jgi:hypothetical protein